MTERKAESERIYGTAPVPEYFSGTQREWDALRAAQPRPARSDDIFVELKYGSHGLLEQFSLEERLRRAEHDAGLLEINQRGRSSHCWLCRRAHEEQQDAERGVR